MSNIIFPTLAGLKWDRLKIPEWSTKVQRTTSGKEARVSFFSYPIWNFTLSFEFLRTDATIDELAALVGLFNQVKGSYDTFLFSDPYDNAVTIMPFGTGDGVTTQFQLTRAYGGAAEPIQNLNGTPHIYINAVETFAFTVGATGIVTFSSPPAIGSSLTWTGNFYFRCRFKNDTMEFNNFMVNLWENKKCEFVSVKL